MTFWTIKRKLLVSSICISFIPISVITVIYFLSARNEIKEQIFNKMIAVAESKKLHIEALLRSIEGRALDFSSDGYIRTKLEKTRHNEADKQDLIFDLKMHLKNNKLPLDPDITSITIIDHQGMVIASTCETVAGKDFSVQEVYANIKEKNINAPHAHNPRFSGYFGYCCLDVTAPIISMESEETIGFVINTYRKKIISDITANHEGMGKSGEVVIGSREGDMIHIINNLRHVTESEHTLRFPLNGETLAPMKQALRGYDGAITGMDYRRINVIAACNHIPSVGWGLVAKMDKEEAFAPLQMLRNTAIIVSGVCSAVFAGLGVIFSLSTAKPINILKQATEKIAGGNLEHIVEINRKDEIGALADSFNNMTGKLTHEITEHKKAEIELRETNRELEAFCYSVSHDLRAPLRSIGGFSKIVETDYADKLDDRGRDYLRRICAATHKMEVLIKDLLDLSRITRKKIKIEHVDLSAMTQQIASDLHNMEPERKVDFVIKEGVSVKGDANLLHIAMSNLINNAWKFTGKHPHARIEFGVSSQGEERVYFINDDGVGFDMTYVDKLFGAFQRLHSSSEFEGTGIGLAIVQRVIHRHGGRVWAEGEVNRGATLYFTL